MSVSILLSVILSNSLLNLLAYCYKLSTLSANLKKTPVAPEASCLSLIVFVLVIIQIYTFTTSMIVKVIKMIQHYIVYFAYMSVNIV